MTSIFSTFLTLVLVMDPLGNVLIILAVLKGVDPKRRQWVIFRELIIALVELLLFLFAGTQILSAMGLKQESIGIAGAISTPSAWLKRPTNWSSYALDIQKRYSKSPLLSPQPH